MGDRRAHFGIHVRRHIRFIELKRLKLGLHLLLEILNVLVFFSKDTVIWYELRLDEAHATFPCTLQKSVVAALVSDSAVY